MRPAFCPFPPGGQHTPEGGEGGQEEGLTSHTLHMGGGDKESETTNAQMKTKQFPGGRGPQCNKCAGGADFGGGGFLGKTTGSDVRGGVVSLTKLFLGLGRGMGVSGVG